jgi:hypothetical protein
MRREQFSIGKLQIGEIDQITKGNGTPNGATVTAEEKGALVRRTVIKCVATPITLTDVGGVTQYGGVKVYDFPAENIAVIGAQVKGTLAGYASLIDAFTGVISLGSVTAAGDATLTSTEANLMASNAISAASKSAPIDAKGAGGVVLGANADAYLNVAVADNAAHGSGDALFTGEIVILWTPLGG